MTFFESASLIGSQGLANWLVKDLQKGFLSPAVAAALMAMISILYIRKGWKGDQHKSAIENYIKSFAGHILKGKDLIFEECYFNICIICNFFFRKISFIEKLIAFDCFPKA